MNYSSTFRTAFLRMCMTLFFSTLLLSCEYGSQSAESLETSENADIVEPPPPPPPPPSSEITQKIVYRDFIVEAPLQNGYRFGMIPSEWNKQIAILARDGIFTNLFDKEYYTGWVMFDTPFDNLNNEGYSIEGVFVEPRNRNDTVEVFKRNGNEINNPILIGIKYDYRINPANVLSFINSIIVKSDLEYLAGEYPIQVNPAPVKTSDFPRDWKEEAAIIKRDWAAIEKCKNTTNVSKSITRETLFQNDEIFAVITWTETTTANVQKNDQCIVTFVFSGKRDLSFFLTIYSKKQSNLKVEDYLTYSQKAELENKKKTQELIDKALK